MAKQTVLKSIPQELIYECTVYIMATLVCTLYSTQYMRAMVCSMCTVHSMAGITRRNEFLNLTLPTTEKISLGVYTVGI